MRTSRSKESALSVLTSYYEALTVETVNILVVLMETPARNDIPNIS
jgi:hypothetical protein